MKKLLILIITALISGTSMFAGTIYTSPITGYVTVSNINQWNAIAWTSSVTGNTYDEYVLQSGFTILIGPSGNHDVNFNPIDVVITVYGRIGFYYGNNTISMTSSSQISVMIGGKVGFGDVTGSWYGGAGDRFYFGTNPADFVKGPFYVFGPDVISLAEPPQSSYLWTGAVSTEWTTGGNWVKKNGNPTCPNSIFNAVIPTSPSGGNFPHVTTTGNSVRALALEPGAVLTIESKGSLTTYDSIHNYGIVNINSDGALVQTATSKSCDYCPGGVFNVERQTGPTSPWFMGSPISGLNEAGFSSCGNGQFSTTTCDPPLTGSAGPCVMSFDQDASINFNCTHNLWFYESSGNFINGKGYCIYHQPGTITFSGSVINNGPISYGPLGYSNKGNVNLPQGFGGTTTRGWHMVSNPYPSPIELTRAQLTAMGFDAQIQRWNSATGTWVSSNPLNNVTIAVGQAFEIRVNGTPGNTGTLALDNSFRVATSGVAFYKTEEIPQQQYLNITVSNGNANENSTAMVYFQDGATTAFDGEYDANRLFGLTNLPYIYTLEQNGEFLSYNALPLLTEGSTQSVPVGLHVGVSGTFTLTFEGLDGFDTNTFIMLEDKSNGQLTDLKTNNTYSFTQTLADKLDRFVIHFSKNIISRVSNEKKDVFKMFNSGNTLYVDFTNMQHVDATINIFNVLGQKISSERFGFSSIYSKQITDIVRGYIIVTTTTGGFVQTGKFFVN